MRSFVAIELPAAVRAELASRVAALRRQLPPARWVPTRNYHLTLRFLGDVEASQAAALAARLAVVFQRATPFELQLVDGGCFPPRRPARVVWAGLAAAPELVALQAEVERACADELVLAPERRPYRPHLTVARCRRPWPPAAAERWRRGMRGALGEAFAVREGVLMESRLGSGGAVYRARARLPLEGGR